MITNTIDAARLELLLTELRLPGVKLMWAKLAQQSDKEGWPAARFLAALAEHELSDRGRRRIERHMAEARLPAGKTLAAFDFETVPMVSKAQVMALASGDAWLAKGANIHVVRTAWRGQKPSLGCARSCPCRERLARAVRPHHRSCAKASGGAPRAGTRKRTSQTRPLRPPHPRRHRLCHQGSGRDQRPVRADRCAL